MGFKLEQEDQGAAPKIQVESDDNIANCGMESEEEVEAQIFLGSGREADDKLREPNLPHPTLCHRRRGTFTVTLAHCTRSRCWCGATTLSSTTPRGLHTSANTTQNSMGTARRRWQCFREFRRDRRICGGGGEQGPGQRG